MVVLLTTTIAYSRVPIRDWSYKQLLAESDLVVIANALETRQVPNGDDMSKNGLQSFPYSFQQVDTTFHVQVVLKGKLEGKQLRLVHFRYAPKTVDIDSGPSLVAFSKDESVVSVENGVLIHGPVYLLFLKARKDGRYDPISGQVDPDFSVRELKDPPRDLLERVRH